MQRPCSTVLLNSLHCCHSSVPCITGVKAVFSLVLRHNQHDMRAQCHASDCIKCSVMLQEWRSQQADRAIGPPLSALLGDRRLCAAHLLPAAEHASPPGACIACNMNSPRCGAASQAPIGIHELQHHSAPCMLPHEVDADISMLASAWSPCGSCTLQLAQPGSMQLALILQGHMMAG